MTVEKLKLIAVQINNGIPGKSAKPHWTRRKGLGTRKKKTLQDSIFLNFPYIVQFNNSKEKIKTYNDVFTVHYDASQFNFTGLKNVTIDSDSHGESRRMEENFTRLCTLTLEGWQLRVYWLCGNS